MKNECPNCQQPIVVTTENYIECPNCGSLELIGDVWQPCNKKDIKVSVEIPVQPEPEEKRNPCKVCGEINSDLRAGVCFDCATKAENERLKREKQNHNKTEKPFFSLFGLRIFIED